MRASPIFASPDKNWQAQQRLSAAERADSPDFVKQFTKSWGEQDTNWLARHVLYLSCPSGGDVSPPQSGAAASPDFVPPRAAVSFLPNRD
ncbi:hypothetical protein THICB2_100006 [Thiomonas sp. CB2]|nr:hypothetical protein THICB2_100006 [Thiomonas sp. CB2]CQR44004.1 hypothetical protein THICB3470073 [Thiomonas sp. CB3]VDY05995.1 protein of unknown function [Thiomonas sp. Bio17B3]VDY10707.1 protein of unknown function [Thiomonas sp. Sup16B3]VDY14257.1 conserved protein of unknown function [Thiomonas sp. OC7]